MAEGSIKYNKYEFLIIKITWMDIKSVVYMTISMQWWGKYKGKKVTCYM